MARNGPAVLRAWLPAALMVAVFGAPGVRAQEAIEQWATSVVGVSSYWLNTPGAPSWIIGAPKGDCEVGPFGSAFQGWRTGEPDAGAEWIEVRFERPVFATAVEVYETLNPGAVTAIRVRDIAGVWQPVWTGADTSRACPAMLRADFPLLPYPVDEVRVELNTALIPGWNQLDAVRLIGYPAPAVVGQFAQVPAGDLYPAYEWPEVPASVASYAFSDYDNDGWPDMFGAVTVGYPMRLALLHNDGDGRYSDRSTTISLDSVIASNAGRVFGDYDNDGDLDLYVAVGSVMRLLAGRDLLLRNDDGRFVEVGLQAGLTDSVISSTAMWLDYDRDGWLDLYVGHGAVGADALDKPNSLYRNNGNGTFTDVTVSVGLDVNLRLPGSLAERVRGTESATAAADLNEDGSPELYVAVEGSPKQVFSYGNGPRFENVGTGELGQSNYTIGVAIGDVDNDGHLDVFQPAVSPATVGVQVDLPERSALMLNLGDGVFVDATAALGLDIPTTLNMILARLWDIDNDADLDLVSVAQPSRLFLNDGHGRFAEAPDWSPLPYAYVSGDYDGDGSLDIWSEQFLFRNRGNANHYLRIDLVGTRSNRDGIGARVYARTGAVRQTRELSGGDGWLQDELMVHFGLGQAIQVDELEIRWPSGQVDVLTDVPADQEIRVIEGRGLWYPAPRTVWTVPPPKSVQFGQPVSIAAVCRPALFEPTATITRITGDLGSLGGPEAVPLIDLGDGTYRLSADFTVGGTSDLRDVEVFVEQQTSLGRHWINLSRNVEVGGQPGTAVAETVGDGVPRVLALAQNWPNPFNSSTTIQFDLPANTDVELAVYDLAGQRLASLVAGCLAAGGHTATWDGRDGDGRPVASGVYVYRLQVDGQRVARRLVLVQ